MIIPYDERSLKRTDDHAHRNEYRESIRDGRASYLEGRRSIPGTHPLLRVSVDWVAGTYDRYTRAAGGPQPDVRSAGDSGSSTSR